MSAEQAAPDAFDPRLECRAWVKASRVIGGPSHSHVCREAAGHRDRHPTSVLRLHRCTCGHTW